MNNQWKPLSLFDDGCFSTSQLVNRSHLITKNIQENVTNMRCNKVDKTDFNDRMIENNSGLHSGQFKSKESVFGFSSIDSHLLMNNPNPTRKFVPTPISEIAFGESRPTCNDDMQGEFILNSTFPISPPQKNEIVFSNLQLHDTPKENIANEDVITCKADYVFNRLSSHISENKKNINGSELDNQLCATSLTELNASKFIENVSRENQRDSIMKGSNTLAIGTWNEASVNQTFPSITNFEIGTFTSKKVLPNLCESNFEFDMSNKNRTLGSLGRNNFQGGPGIRETGIIEKLLHSYGFIQCCDRQARLFFHFSQFDGNIEHLKIGDPVEFEMTYDKRTGKPIASMVSKIAPEVVMSEERVVGMVTTEAKIDSVTGQDIQGRISYENRGECFFLPFTLKDVEGNVVIHSGDKVSFQVATLQRSGNLVARTVRLENPASPVKYQGVVNVIRDGFGFIERADVVKDIFFPFTEVIEKLNSELIVPDLGEEVEFNIQTNNGKEIACNIALLPQGTVVFEDIGTEVIKGQVLKPPEKRQRNELEALSGRIKFRGEDRAEEEISFNGKDQIGQYTLKHGDWVQFVIAIDRRDKLKRATKIELMDDSFNVSDEKREQGIIEELRNGYGFIKCADRDGRMLFYFSEVLDVNREIQASDEVEFTVVSSTSMIKKQLAIRIKHLPRDTIQFSAIIHKGLKGTVAQDLPLKADALLLNHLSYSSNPKMGAGKILYSIDNIKLEIPFFIKDCKESIYPVKGDLVSFDINQCKATKETNAINIVVQDAPSTSIPQDTQIKHFTQSNDSDMHYGYVVAKRDGYGFLETIAHSDVVFFHFGSVNGKVEELEVGSEVKYLLQSVCGKKKYGEKVTLIPEGTIPKQETQGEIFQGKIVRPMRSVNPDQDDYFGLIEIRKQEGLEEKYYKFGISSLFNHKDMPQLGDCVEFQVSKCKSTFATNVKTLKEKKRAFVEAMRGPFGFLSYEVEDGRKLFFLATEVENNVALQPGDEVEFVFVTNKKTNKHSACCVRRLCSAKRPDRLISKLKSITLEDAVRLGKKIIIIRQPKGPDGRGFKMKRK